MQRHLIRLDDGEPLPGGILVSVDPRRVLLAPWLDPLELVECLLREGTSFWAAPVTFRDQGTPKAVYGMLADRLAAQTQTRRHPFYVLQAGGIAVDPVSPGLAGILAAEATPLRVGPGVADDRGLHAGACLEPRRRSDLLDERGNGTFGATFVAAASALLRLALAQAGPVAAPILCLAAPSVLDVLPKGLFLPDQRTSDPADGRNRLRRAFTQGMLAEFLGSGAVRLDRDERRVDLVSVTPEGWWQADAQPDPQAVDRIAAMLRPAAGLCDRQVIDILSCLVRLEDIRRAGPQAESRHAETVAGIERRLAQATGHELMTAGAAGAGILPARIDGA